jgi:Ca2+-binding EF-hand superfamily protein
MTIRKMKKNVVMMNGFEAGETISFFKACEEYEQGLINRKELKSIYKLAMGVK